jgi:hypothetical protein
MRLRWRALKGFEQTGKNGWHASCRRKENMMFGMFKTYSKAKTAQKGLTEAFKVRGHDFMTMNSVVHEAFVKEAMATCVDATIAHFVGTEIAMGGRANQIIEYYRQRSKSFV